VLAANEPGSDIDHVVIALASYSVGESLLSHYVERLAGHPGASNHEQLVGGANGQVFMGCRVPADTDYAPQLAQDGIVVAGELARRGVIGRIGIDFVTVCDQPGDGAGAPWRSTCAREAPHTHTRHCATSSPGTTTPSADNGSAIATPPPALIAPPTTSTTLPGRAAHRHP
jgi:hypothetical protein